MPVVMDHTPSQTLGMEDAYMSDILIILLSLSKFSL